MPLAEIQEKARQKAMAVKLQQIPAKKASAPKHRVLNKIELIQLLISKGRETQISDYEWVAKCLQGGNKNEVFQAKRIKDALDLLLMVCVVEIR